MTFDHKQVDTYLGNAVDALVSITKTIRKAYDGELDGFDHTNPEDVEQFLRQAVEVLATTGMAISLVGLYNEGFIKDNK